MKNGKNFSDHLLKLNNFFKLVPIMKVDSKNLIKVLNDRENYNNALKIYGLEVLGVVAMLIIEEYFNPSSDLAILLYMIISSALYG